MDNGKLRALASDCVHCGFCLPACPTYALWGEEMDSPRGRIHLVTQVLDGAELTPAAAEHFDRCLGCMACMTACPSGVQYDRLIEAARAWTDDPAHAPAADAGTGTADIHEVAGVDGPGEASGGHLAADVAGGTPVGSARAGGPSAGGIPAGGTPAGGIPVGGIPVGGIPVGGIPVGGIPVGGIPVGGGRHRPWQDRAARAAIFAVFPYPRRLRAMAAPLRMLQRTGLDRVVARSGLPGRVSPVLGAAMNLAPRPSASVPAAGCPSGCRPAGRGARWWGCSPAACNPSSSPRSTSRPRACWRPRAAMW